MKTKSIEKPAFSVIGKLGLTDGKEGFVATFWQEANAHFGEISPLVKRNEKGVPVGFYGAMSDREMKFLPWQNDFSEAVSFVFPADFLLTDY
ncbi:MAG: hypothetical protein MJ082_02695 [Clostridia bacterium]|nr:hypothetical protein [Clostridia bacterium]